MDKKKTSNFQLQQLLEKMGWEKRPFYKPQHRFINLPMKEGILLQIFSRYTMGRTYRG